MTITGKMRVDCPGCGKFLMVPTSAQGKQVRCPSCKHVFSIEPRLAVVGAAQPALTAAPEAPAFSPPPAASVPVLQPPPPVQLPPLVLPRVAPKTTRLVESSPAKSLPSRHDTPPLSAEATHVMRLPQEQPLVVPQKPVDKIQLPPIAVQPPAATLTPVVIDPGTSKKKTDPGAGMMGGLAMMIIAVIWFALGLACNYIFFYPPILFIIGLIAFVKGIAKGNL